MAKEEVSKQGWSFARILLLTVVVGIAAGTALGVATAPTETAEEIAEAEVKRLMPRGEPLSGDDPMAADPASLSGIPPYPGVFPRRLTRQATAQGGPMAISWFSTQEPASTVLDFYERAFNAEGRRPVAHRYSEDMGYVAWLDEHNDGGTAAGVLHMVSAMKQFSQTIVLISASRPDIAMNTRPMMPDGLVQPPASTDPQVVNMGETGFASEVVYSRTLNTSPGEVVSFYEKQFKERGFDVTETTSSAAQASVTAVREGTTVVVAARLEGSHSSVVLTYERRAPQEVSP